MRHKEQRDAQNDYKKFAGLVEKEKQEREREKQRLIDNQKDLFKQMEERQQINIISETMN